MIVSASYRTDIPAFYGAWFLARLKAGSCRVANPYGGAPGQISLRPGDVEGFVFWTRNAAPFFEAFDAVRALGLPFVVQYSLTGYPRALEASVVQVPRAIATMQEIANRFGPRALVWRYDPVLVTSLTPADWHRAQFERLARALAGSCDEVVLSFAQIYAKTRRNLDRAAAAQDVTWRDPDTEEKKALLADLAGIAGAHGMSARLCAQPELLGPNLPGAACIDSERLADIAGRPIEVRAKGNRPGCLCAESRDIGAYDSCPHGCVYCYAVRRPELAKRRHRSHDVEGEFLIEPWKEAPSP